MAHRDTSARIDSTVGSTRVAGWVRTSTAAVSFRPWPVRTQTTVLPGSRPIVRERGEAGRGRRLAEDALEAGELEPHSGDVLVADRDGLDGAVGDERVDLGEVRRLGDPDRRRERRRPLVGLGGDRSAAARRPRRSPSRTRRCCRRRRTAARARRARAPSASAISNAAVFWPSIRFGFSELTSTSEPRSTSSRQLAAPRRSCRAPRARARRRPATARAWPRRSRRPGTGRRS